MGNIVITIDADDHKAKCIAKFIKNHFKQFSISVENHCGDDDINLMAALINIGTSGNKIIIKKPNNLNKPNTGILKSTDLKRPTFKQLKTLNTVVNNPPPKQDIKKENIVYKTPFDVAVMKFKYNPPTLVNENTETFVPIPGYIREYEISNFGVIRTKGINNRRSKFIKISSGGQVKLTSNSVSINYNVSRLVYGTFKGVVPNEMRFKDNDNKNRKLTNLIMVH